MDDRIRSVHEFTVHVSRKRARDKAERGRGRETEKAARFVYTRLIVARFITTLKGERRRRKGGVIVGPSVNKVIPPPSRHPFHSVPRYLDPSCPGLVALPFRFLVHIHTRLSVEERFVGIKRYFSAPPRLVATFRP